MRCNRCKTIDKDGNPVQGRVFVDRIFSEKRHIELFCLRCGKRWMLDKTDNVFAIWLLKSEQARANAALANV